MIATMAAFALTGRWPGGASMVRFSPNGIVEMPPEKLDRVLIAEGGDRIGFRRNGKEWTFETAETEAAAGERIETALRFLNVSAPLRVLVPGEFADADVREFGLDPPRQIVALSFYGLLLALAFMIFQAPDVALSQVVIGAVALPLMLLLALSKIRKDEISK